jgi:anti-sigma factor RsiW
MKIDEETLRAFVDGELSPAERSRVEAVLSNSADLKRTADAMHASRVPYRAAFDAQSLPSMPAALQQHLANLSAAAGVAAPSSQAKPSHWNRLALLGMGVGIAAAFAAGVTLNPNLFHGKQSSPEIIAATNSETAPWVQAIASYQALYVRETVDRMTDNAEHAQTILRNFEAKEKAKLTVPNLMHAGLEFKRIQLLGFGDRQLVQMAYLPSVPSEGKPGALCVLRSTNAKDAAPTARRIENLSIVTWQKDQLAFVLALDMPIEQALKIGQKLGAHEYPVLYAV